MIIECIYIHPIFMINEFINDTMSLLLQKLQKESSKFFFLRCNFSTDLLKYGKASKRLHCRIILETIRFKVVR